MQKDTSRSAYTRRIMEILVNIQKQKDDIGKVTLKSVSFSLNIMLSHCFLSDFRRHSTGSKGNQPAGGKTRESVYCD